MFNQLTQKLGSALQSIQGSRKLTESNIKNSLEEIRIALINADVHFQVVKNFIEKIKFQCLGVKITPNIQPRQQVIKIINDEIVRLFGETTKKLPSQRPWRIMLIGLHGAGKTTTTVKLAKYLAKRKNYSPIVIGCDVYRPAASNQLTVLAKKENLSYYCNDITANAVNIAQEGTSYGIKKENNLFLYDTAGRLQIDNDLILEIQNLKEKIKPQEILLVTDSAIGQEAVNVAKMFNEAVNVTGIILTKLDGDSRGGAALSMKAITDLPIQYMGIGEKIEDLEIFHPERIAKRILGMGDIVSLVEKAQEKIGTQEAELIAKKIRNADFTLVDFLKQLKTIKKMGPIASLLKMLPGVNNIQIEDKTAQDQINRTEAIIHSMTFKERKNPKIINFSRKLRIAKGCGMEVQEINNLLKQFSQMKKMMKKMKGKKNNEKLINNMMKKVKKFIK